MLVATKMSAQKKINWEVVKWGIILLLTIVALGLNYHFAGKPGLLRLAGGAIWAISLILIAWQTNLGKRFLAFAKEARNELQRVVWPTRPETIQTTLVVMLMVVVMSLLLWSLDALLLWLITFFTGQKG